MNGISLINDPNGKPAVITIDLRSLDPDVSPLVEALLGRINIDQNTITEGYTAVSFEQERRKFLETSAMNLNRAYGDDEPEYTVDDLIEKNPNYKPQ